MRFATKTSIDRLSVPRKSPRFRRLTVASRVQTIIKDYEYCSWWLNGKRLAKRRQAKIWLIIMHSLDNLVRSELPARKSDMAVKEIGKLRTIWRNLRTVLYNSTNALTLTSKSMTKPEPRTQIYTKYDVDSLSLVRTVLHRITLLNPGMVWDVYSWWCEQTSVRIVYPLTILRRTLISYIHANTSSDSAHL